jgi:hypothetical protein
MPLELQLWQQGSGARQTSSVQVPSTICRIARRSLLWFAWSSVRCRLDPAQALAVAAKSRSKEMEEVGMQGILHQGAGVQCGDVGDEWLLWNSTESNGFLLVVSASW